LAKSPRVNPIDPAQKTKVHTLRAQQVSQNVEKEENALTDSEYPPSRLDGRAPTRVFFPKLEQHDDLRKRRVSKNEQVSQSSTHFDDSQN
jgi:hypothetical protein